MLDTTKALKLQVSHEYENKIKLRLQLLFGQFWPNGRRNMALGNRLEDVRLKGILLKFFVRRCL